MMSGCLNRTKAAVCNFIFLTLVLLTLRCEAALIELHARLDGSQAVPPISTPGAGIAVMVFDTVTKEFSWNINFDGLSSQVSSAQFQGPAGPGENGNIIFSISEISGLNSPLTGTVTLNSTQEVDLLAGLWYINIRTGLAPSGEIRGQVEMLEDSSSQRIIPGDLNGDGRDDLVVLTVDGQIFYTLNLLIWIKIPGVLNQIATGDLNGDLKDDLVGLAAEGQIFYTLDLRNWTHLPGILRQLTTGDLNSDGRDDIAGLAFDGQVYYTLDLATWNNIEGTLSQVTTGDLTGNGFSNLAGLSHSELVYITLDLQNWLNVPGRF
jgi:hypothetical protein